jgi:hypothetical protein
MRTSSPLNYLLADQPLPKRVRPPFTNPARTSSAARRSSPSGFTSHALRILFLNSTIHTHLHLTVHPCPPTATSHAARIFTPLSRASLSVSSSGPSTSRGALVSETPVSASVATRRDTGRRKRGPNRSREGYNQPSDADGSADDRNAEYGVLKRARRGAPYASVASHTGRWLADRLARPRAGPRSGRASATASRPGRRLSRCLALAAASRAASSRRPAAHCRRVMIRRARSAGALPALAQLSPIKGHAEIFRSTIWRCSLVCVRHTEERVVARRAYCALAALPESALSARASGFAFCASLPHRDGRTQQSPPLPYRLDLPPRHLHASARDLADRPYCSPLSRTHVFVYLAPVLAGLGVALGIRGRCACGLRHQHPRFDPYRRAERPKERRRASSRKCRDDDERATYSAGALASERGETRRMRPSRDRSRACLRVRPAGPQPGHRSFGHRPTARPRARGSRSGRSSARFPRPCMRVSRRSASGVEIQTASRAQLWASRTRSRRRTTHPKTSTKFWTRRCRPAACSAARARPARRRRKDVGILVARAMYVLSLSEAGRTCLVCFHSNLSTFGV